MTISFKDKAFDELTEWSLSDKKTYKKILSLIKEIQRDPFHGTGKPEPLKYGYSGSWSRRINDEDRLVYTVEENTVFIASCKFHYQ